MPTPRYLNVLLALIQWGDNYVKEAVTLCCDNVGALQDALDLKGSSTLLPVARELAWRRARCGWKFVVAHLPAEANTGVDTLSRRYASPQCPLPPRLESAIEVHPDDVDLIWRC